MNDTSSETERRYHGMLMARSSQERLFRGINMFLSARRLALASLWPDSTIRGVRRYVLKCFYGLSLEHLECS